MNAIIEAWNRAAAAWWSWTVTSTWQGFLLLALVAIFLYLGRSLRPGLRYGLLLVVLLKLAVPPLVGLPYGFADLLARWTDPAPAVPEPAGNLSVKTYPAAAVTPDLRATRKNVGDGLSRLSLPAWLLAINAAGVIALAMVILRHVLKIRHVLRSSRCPDPLLTDRLQAIAARMGLRRAPAMYINAELQSPHAGGVLRPFVLLPAWAASADGEVQDILLAHELAHVRRFDALANSLQALVQSLLWWNPMVWWLNRRIREERELCCDALVIARGIATGVAYSRTLVDVAEHISAPSRTWVLVGMADAFHAIDRRVRVALEKRSGPTRGTGVVTCLLVLLAAGWVLPGASRGVADATPPELTDLVADTGVIRMRDVNFSGISRVPNQPEMQCLFDASFVLQLEGGGGPGVKIESERLAIVNGQSGTGVAEGDLTATWPGFSINAKGFTMEQDGTVAFYNVASRGGPLLGLKADRFLLNLSDGSFQVVRGNIDQIEAEGRGPLLVAAKDDVPDTAPPASGAEPDSSQGEPITLSTKIVKVKRAGALVFPDGKSLAARIAANTEDAQKYPLSGMIAPGEWPGFEKQLKALSGAGEAEVQASPRVVTRSGEKAEIKIQTEIPYVDNGKTVFLEVGTTVGFLPTIQKDDQGKEFLNLQTEFVQSEQSGTRDGKPVIDTRGASSELKLDPAHLDYWQYLIVEGGGEKAILILYHVFRGAPDKAK